MVDARSLGAARPHRRWVRHLRWLVLPGTIGLFALVSMAISTEDRRSFDGDEAADATEADPLNNDSSNPSGGEAEIDAQDATGSEAAGQDGNDDGNGQENDQDEGSGGSTVEITSDAGRVDVELGNGSNPIARPSTGGAEPADPVELNDGVDQGSQGLRLTEDGRLEPTEGAEIEPGDLVIEQAGDGFDLVGADGRRVEVRPAADGEGGFEVTEISADGQRQSLNPDEAGGIDLGDGVVLRVPIEGTLDPAANNGADESAGEESQQLSLWEQLTETAWRWVVLAFLALAALAAIINSYLRDDDEADEPFGPDFVGPEGIPIDRFDEFLDMLRNDPDPARALRLAFHAAERGMGDLPPRHSIETPFEWCDRVVIGRPHLGRPLRSLCDRFANARFAAERPSNATRDAALAELLELNQLANGHRPAREPIGASR